MHPTLNACAAPSSNCARSSDTRALSQKTLLRVDCPRKGSSSFMSTSINHFFAKNFISACALLLALAGVANAQALGSNRGPVGGEGSNTIEGRVYFPSGDQDRKSTRLNSSHGH